MSGERLSVWFEGPRRIGVRRDRLGEPPPGQLAVRTRLALVSAGSELAAWRGQLDPELARDETLPALAGGGFRFPFQYGYASVGEVEGPGADRRVFAFVPHQSRFHAPPADLLAVPAGMSEARAVCFPYCETAVNLLLDGPPTVGARVVVVGQGPLGLALTGLLARFPLADLTVVEPRPERRKLALGFGAGAAVAPEAAGSLGARADLVFEVSGSGAALDRALGLVARDGTLVVGSWLADRPTGLDLGGWFHRGRLRLKSSQVSHLPPLPGWTVARRREMAWRLLGSLPLDELPTLRVPMAEAARAYAGLDAGAAVIAMLEGAGA